MRRRKDLRTVVAVFLCLAMAIPAVPTNAAGPKITVQIGRPSIWSLGQAHYLLSNMHLDNKDLKVPNPNGQLNPSSPNGARMELIRTIFQAGAGFDAGLGVENRAAMQRFNQNSERLGTIRVRIDDLRTRIASQGALIASLDSQILPLEAQNSSEDAVKQQITRLKAERTALDNQRTAFDKDLTSLLSEQQALMSVALNVTGGSFETPAAKATDDLNTVLTKTLDKLGSPSLSASMVLDSYISMQYEVIAKQLTLLRDEVGPDERVVFLELPASIYTVPGKADGTIVRLEWTVDEYVKLPANLYDRLTNERGDLTNDPDCGLASQMRPVTLDILEFIMGLKEKETFEGLAKAASRLFPELEEFPRTESELQKEVLKEFAAIQEDIKKNISDKLQARIKPITSFLDSSSFSLQAFTLDSTDSSLRTVFDAAKQLRRELEIEPDAVTDESRRSREAVLGRVYRLQALAAYPSFLREIAPSIKSIEWKKLSGDVSKHTAQKMRAIDIIPRQSALNVNETYGTQSTSLFGGAIQLLTGFGAKTSFERQRTQFEQFLQQEVYASGFGKGNAKFGWTFGSLPGTNRIAPGVRTTYAVVAIPRDAVAVKIKAAAAADKRKKSPDDLKAFKTTDEFTLLVPQEFTDGFWVESIAYTPVQKSRRVVAILEGPYISPQAGVLVNGVPLKRAVSIGRNEGDRTSVVDSFNDVSGEFEYLASKKMILSFSMGNEYSGTPTITVVTPEKSASINSFCLEINYNKTKAKLRDVALLDPMFVEPLSIKEVKAISGTTPSKLRILGAGLRPEAQIYVGETRAEAVHKSTEEYVVVAAADKPATIRFGQPTRQGFDWREIKYTPEPPKAPKLGASYEVLDFYGAAKALKWGATLLVSAGTSALKVTPVTKGVTLAPPSPLGDKLQIDLESESVDFDLKLETADKPGEVMTVQLPAPPAVSSVLNASDDSGTGHVDEEVAVLIRGNHLQRVKRVWFGTALAPYISPQPNVIYLRTPKSAEGRVPVILETDIEYQGQKVWNSPDFSNGSKSYFTFKKKKQ